MYRGTMLLALVVAVSISLGHISIVSSSCSANTGKSTCITEDLLQMIFRLQADGKTEKDDINRPAFFASLSKRPTTVDVAEIIKFDDARINKGGGYNPSTGIFTAPRSGLYVIACLIASENGSNFGYQLNKNDHAYVNGYTSNAVFGSHTTIALVQMKKGDRVYIKHRHNKKEQLAGNHYSNFAGFFLGK